MANGPKDFKDAEKSPLWSRLSDRHSTNVFVLVPNQNTEQLIPQLENIIEQFDRRDFRIHMAGAPYAVELIRRSLTHDFRTFTLTSVALFGLAMWAVFHSGRLAVGMVATCITAVLLTLLVQAAFGQKDRGSDREYWHHCVRYRVVAPGIDGLQLAIASERRATREEQRELGRHARRMKFPASFWSMVCSSLGFASLLIVPAKPLRQLAIGGVLGTVLALACAYLMYPAFLSSTAASGTRIVGKGISPGFWSRRFIWLAVLVVLASFGRRKLELVDGAAIHMFGSVLRVSGN